MLSELLEFDPFDMEPSPPTKKQNREIKETLIDNLAKNYGNARLQFKKLSLDAVGPKRATRGSAGYDLSSAENITVPARGRALIQTHIAIAFSSGYYGRIAPRSGLAFKNGIDVGAGVIDEDYRGSVGVILFNHNDSDFEVKKGDRIAQLILEKIVTPDPEEVSELPPSISEHNGYGSTGK